MLRKVTQIDDNIHMSPIAKCLFENAFFENQYH